MTVYYINLLIGNTDTKCVDSCMHVFLFFFWGGGGGGGGVILHKTGKSP